ncbi:MAG: hypothetical protein U1E27_04470 [Kiritimatiellia bacterium]|nr:hypothetical protein [Kiritimatiellia bacterium]
MNRRRRAGGLGLAILALLLGSSACRTAVPAARVRHPAETHIRVLHVDARQGYVLLECMPPLPANTEVELFRENRAVAVVRLLSFRRPSVVAADILSGEPLSGDQGRPLPVPQENPTP